MCIHLDPGLPCMLTVFSSFLFLILVLAFPFQDEGLEAVSWCSGRRIGGGERSGGSAEGYSLVSMVVVA